MQGATGTVWPRARAQKHGAGCPGNALLVLLDLKCCQLPRRAVVMLPLLLRGEQLVAAPCPDGGWPPLCTSGRTHLGHNKHLPWELLLCLFGRAPFSSAFFFFFLIPAFNKRPEACVPCLEQSVPTQHLTATRSFQQVQNPGGMQPPGGWGRGSRGCCCFFRGEQPHGCTVSICLSRFRWDGASRAPLASAVTSVCAIK